MSKSLISHMINVGKISFVFGSYIGLNREELKDLYFGSLCHDIGKLFVDQDVLSKKGKLSTEEVEEMKRHPQLGYEKLEILGISENIRTICLQHHENADGSGYPKKLKNNEVYKLAKIVRLTDSYDAMTTDRIYKQGITHEESMKEIMLNGGTQFSNDYLFEFIKFLRQYRSKKEILKHFNELETKEINSIGFEDKFKIAQ